MTRAWLRQSSTRESLSSIGPAATEELASLRTEVADLRGLYDQAIGSATQAGIPPGTEVAETRQLLENAEITLVSQLTADRDDFRALADDFARENDDLTRAGAAERERDYLRAESLGCDRQRMTSASWIAPRQLWSLRSRPRSASVETSTVPD